MEPTVLFTLLCIAVAIAFFSFLAVALWAGNRRREREAYYKNETIKRIAETQEPVANAALEFLREQEKIRTRRTREGLKLAGVVTMAVGLGLFPFLGVFVSDKFRDQSVYLVGLIPLLIGLALLVYVYLLAPKER